MDNDSQIVIGPDGTVIAAHGLPSSGLVDVPLQQCQGLSRTVRKVGEALLRELRDSRDRVAVRRVPNDVGSGTVTLVAIEALPIRRGATDLRALLPAKLSLLTSQASAVGVTLHIIIGAEVPAAVAIDAEKMAWAVTTLVGNALRYIRAGSRRGPGGTIHVRTSFRPVTAELVVDVQDDGPGIPADTVVRLFRRDGLNVRGAGLALFVMADLCIAHGGTIHVSSSVDASTHGTTVRLTFVARTIARSGHPEPGEKVVTDQ